MAYVPAALRVGGYTIDTTQTSHALPFGGVASLQPRDHRRLQDGLRRLQGLGQRPLAEFVVAIAHGRRDLPGMLDLLEEFSQLSPEIIRQVGADAMPAPTLLQVPL